MSVKKRETPAAQARRSREYENAYGQYRAEKSNNIVRKELMRQVKGKPSRSQSSESVFRSGWIGISRAIKLVVTILLLAGFLTAGIVGGILVGYITTATPVRIVELKNLGTLTTHIYDNAGNELTKFTGSANIDRETIAYDDIKATYIDDAFIF